MFLCLLLFFSSTKSTFFSIQNNRIIDEYGRESYFQGLNVVYKSPPWLPKTDTFNYQLSFSEEDMKLLQSLGINLIRLGVMWPGVAPERGNYNYTYINNAKNLIQSSYKYGIHTLVDCHQDVISSQTCGEGAPTWAIQPRIWNFPEPHNSPYIVDNITHIPSQQDCLSELWTTYYTTITASSAFQRIYENYDNLADEFANHWNVLAKEFKDVDGIIGFELMNEPWAGDIFEDPTLLWPGVADKKNLQGFYDRIAPKIYSADPNRMIFFESVVWTDEFNVTWDETGFDHVPGGEQYSNQSVFSFHYYKLPNIGDKNKYFYSRTNEANNKFNCGSMLTEFDVTNDYELNELFDIMSETMNYCNKYFISWIGWEYKPLAGALPNGTCTGCGNGIFLNNGTINKMTAKAVSRTYAQFVSGYTTLISFDYSNGNFELVYNLNTNINEPTIIYVNLEYWYVNGYNLTINPLEAITKQNVSENGNLIYLYGNNDSKYNGQSLKTKSTLFSIKNGRIIDEYGRECYFQGLNVVYKSPPWLPPTDTFNYQLSFSSEDMKLLQSLGINLIRLGVMWPGVAPERGNYNYTYINNAKNLIQSSYKYGIHTLVDCHQDVISSQTCGEGAPTWAIQPRIWNFPEPHNSPYVVDNITHIPSQQDCLSELWTRYRTTYTASSVYQRIYENYDNLADEFANYWSVLAAEFKGVDGIIGFELMNEPWAGDIFEDPTLLWPGVADKKNLQGFYDRIAPKIYSEDPNRMIFFESVEWTDDFNATWTQTGFDHVPGGEQYSNQSVFSFHFYKIPNVGDKNKYFYSRTHEANNKFNCGSMLTEFGITNDFELDQLFDIMSETMNYCNKYFISWIGWEYKPLAGALPNGTCTGCGNGIFLNNGTINAMTAKAVSRTHAQFVSGYTTLINFDYNNGNFELIYNLNTNINKPTVIYVNLEYWYINGYNLTINPLEAITKQNVSENGNLIYLYTNDNTYNGESIKILINAL